MGAVKQARHFQLDSEPTRSERDIISTSSTNEILDQLRMPSAYKSDNNHPKDPQLEIAAIGVFSLVRKSVEVVRNLYQLIVYHVDSNITSEDILHLTQRLNRKIVNFDQERKAIEREIGGKSTLRRAETIFHDLRKCFDDLISSQGMYRAKESQSLRGLLQELQFALSEGTKPSKTMQRYSLDQILARGNAVPDQFYIAKLLQSHDGQKTSLLDDFPATDFKSHLFATPRMNRFIENPNVNYKLDPDATSRMMPAGMDVIALHIMPELLGNALEHAAMNGKRFHLTINVHYENGEWCFCVTDKSGGIDLAKLNIEDPNEIFKDGITSKGPGRGSGLFLIREVLTKIPELSTTLLVDTVIGKGTTISIRLREVSPLDEAA